MVDFSGGRDSSLVLAVATHVARREGLPLPIPRTNRFAHDPGSKEDGWQELVVRHLGLQDWQVDNITGELDVLGRHAQAFLTHYGLLVPPWMYVLVPSLELARGGSRLTGEGGDEILGPRRATFLRLALDSPRQLSKPRSRSVVARNVAPRAARFLMLWSQYSKENASSAWLQPAAARRFARDLALSEAGEPLNWASSLRWHLSRRSLVATQHNLRLVAADYDVLNVDPLLDRAFVAALARCGGRYGFASRAQAMTYLARDLLPPEVLRRRDKTAYRTTYFTEIARSFAEGWDGRGVDEDLVDPERLRAKWLSPTPPATSHALMQAAWLASQKGTPPFKQASPASVPGSSWDTCLRPSRPISGDPARP